MANTTGDYPQTLHSRQGRLRESRHERNNEARTRTSTPVMLFSSAFAGSIEAFATYPFEYAKTRVQLHTAPGYRQNPFSVLAAVAKQEGPSTMYTGCSTLVLGSASKVSVRFASFNFLRRQLEDASGTLTPARGIAAGFGAGLSESIIAVTPTERLKTVLIESVKGKVRSHHSGLLAFKLIVQTQGISGLYRGLLPTILKQSTTQAVKMGSYNMIKQYSVALGTTQSSITTFLHGALAGAITVYLTQPLDAVKTTAQSTNASGTLNACRSILHRHGLGGFWGGSTSRLARLVFSSGILYTVYEKSTAVLTGSLQNELFVFVPATPRQAISC